MDGEDGSQLNLVPICFATIRHLSKKSKVRKTSLSCFCTYFKEYFLKKKTKSIFVCVTAKSDPGVTGPLHLFPLPIINASKFKDGFNHCYLQMKVRVEILIH